MCCSLFDGNSSSAFCIYCQYPLSAARDTRGLLAMLLMPSLSLFPRNPINIIHTAGYICIRLAKRNNSQISHEWKQQQTDSQQEGYTGHIVWTNIEKRRRPFQRLYRRLQTAVSSTIGPRKRETQDATHRGGGTSRPINSY